MSVSLRRMHGCHRNTNSFRKNFHKWKVLNIYMTKYTNVTSRRQGKCIRKYVTICVLMALELHAPSPPSATHKLLVIVVHVSVTQTNREIPCLVKLHVQ